MSEANEYILGTHDEEINRLGLQHRVWRPRALDAWRRAGITVGQKVLDVGCGPGYATCDLAEIVGPTGTIHAMDRSRRFLDVLEQQSSHRNLANIVAHPMDVDEAALPEVDADAAWARWVFAFVKNPRKLLGKVHRSLKPGGVFVVHEYLDYAAWRLLPRSSDFEEFVRVVMESWRADGGEPDIGAELAVWFSESGFRISELRPIVDIVGPSNFVWQWPKAFIDVNLRRLVDLGHLTQERAALIAKVVEERERSAGSLMVTPVVLEIIATKEV